MPFSNAPAERVFSDVRLVKKLYQTKQKSGNTDEIIQTRYRLLNEEKTPSEINFPNNLNLKALKSLHVQFLDVCTHLNFDNAPF